MNKTFSIKVKNPLPMIRIHTFLRGYHIYTNHNRKFFIALKFSQQYFLFKFDIFFILRSDPEPDLFYFTGPIKDPHQTTDTDPHHWYTHTAS